MPHTLAPYHIPLFVKELQSGTTEITGQPLNRDAGMGTEVPCIYYTLFGPQSYVTKAEQMTNKVS